MDNNFGLQQSYTKSVKKEKKNEKRDKKNLELIMPLYFHDFMRIKNYQIHGTDIIATLKSSKKLDPKRDFYIDVKSSDKTERKTYTLELYQQQQFEDGTTGTKYKSWSKELEVAEELKEQFIVAFMDEEKATIIKKIDMIPVIEEIERLYPEVKEVEDVKAIDKIMQTDPTVMIFKYLEKRSEEDKKKGKKDTWKWIVRLTPYKENKNFKRDTDFFKKMKPALLKFKNGKVVNVMRYDVEDKNRKIYPKKLERKLVGRAVLKVIGRKVQLIANKEIKKEEE